MATLFMDNFEVYGTPATMLDGMYAEVVGGATPTFVSSAPFLYLPNSGDAVRYTLPATYTTIFVAARVKMFSLPSAEGQSFVMQLRDGLNNAVICWYIDTTGRIVVKRGNTSGTELARSATPVIQANTLHHVEAKFVINGATGSVEIRVNDNDIPSINVSGVNTAGGAGSVAQIYPSSTTNIDSWMTDFHIWDTTGTRNIDFLGDVAVSTLWPNVDVQTGWTPNYRHKIGTGILSTNTSVGTAFTCNDASTFELGSGDYTLETFIRFASLPTGSNRVPIFQKWYEDTNQRSYELSKCGPSLNSGNIEFRISTNGTAGTVSTIISQPWDPETDRWYHLALVRSSGQTMLFIDGIMQGVPITDANTYYNGTALWAVGGGVYNFFGNQEVTNSSLSVYGWFDETRMSLVARYTANFTPTTVPFGRNSTDDPDFASVSFLAGYDNGLADESSFLRAITRRTINNVSTVFCFTLTTDDGSFQYQTINAEDTLAGGPPRDDTNISASLYHASATLTLVDNPSNTETVTIAGQVYTFKTVLASAYDVLIGADMEATLHNLVAAVNQDAGEGTLYGTGTVANTDVYGAELPSPQCQVIALLAGTAGNSITVADALDGSWSGATLSGGADIPGPSSFRLTRLPPGVTTIRSIMAITRAYKTESGPAKMRTNFVGPAGAVDNGAEVSLPIDPAYRTDVFEEDPDTTGPITPATMVQARIQFDRTE